MWDEDAIRCGTRQRQGGMQELAGLHEQDGYTMGTAAAGRIFPRGDATRSHPCSCSTSGCSGASSGPACPGRVLGRG